MRSADREPVRDSAQKKRVKRRQRFLPLAIGRANSVAAVEAALAGEEKTLVLLAQRTSGDDLKVPFGMPFTRLSKLKPGETVAFSFIIFKSRAHRDAVNARVMKDPLLAKMPKKMPFDPKRMAYGGFKVLVEA